MIDLGDYSLVVTGFPRSGTSLTMLMLAHGGVEVLQDVGNTTTHKHNPYGSLEMKNVGEAIRENDKDWTKGKAIKIVAPYVLEHYPIDRPTRAIFVQRDINEIITSLLAMKTVWEYQPADAIADARGYLEYNDVPTHFINYKDIIKYPRSTCIGIAEFLEAELDIDNMMKAVDPKARTRYKTEKHLVGYKKEDHLLTFDMSRYIQSKEDLLIDNWELMEVEPIKKEKEDV